MPRRPRKQRTVFKKRRNVCVKKEQPTSEDRSARPISNLQDKPSPSCSGISNVDRPTLDDVDSASKIKIGDVDEKYSVYSEQTSVNIVLELDLLSEALLNSVKCAKCDSSSITVRNISNIGLASKLEIFCTNCTFTSPFMSSRKIQSKNLYEVNTRLAYAMRAIGKGRTPAQTFCGIMNLPPPPARFMPYVDILGSAVEDICFGTMKDAVEEAVSLNDNVRDLTIAIDGTWQTRGFKSLNGVVTATSFDTGRVIDVSIMTKHCICPNKTEGRHLPTCKANYQGSSGGMEVQGAKDIFNHSVSAYNVRYTKYLGDGDSKSFSAIQTMNPYGQDCPVAKLECIGHVQKRMGSRLRRLKSENKSLKLSDGKGLSGPNRLTSAVIDQLQTYYGQAIRRHSNSLNDMKHAIWALYYHKISTDIDPHHGLCPKGEDSWCKFNSAKAKNISYSHRNSIPVAVMEFIKPVFKSLADPELLRKCLHGKTQNPNESVNHVIWSRLPKSGFVGIKTLHLGVYDAVSTFNIGQISRCRVFDKLGIAVGKNTVNAMVELDKSRLRDSERKSAEIKKIARQKKRQVKRKLEDKEEDADNPSYGPGMF